MPIVLEAILVEHQADQLPGLPVSPLAHLLHDDLLDSDLLQYLKEDLADLALYLSLLTVC